MTRENMKYTNARTVLASISELRSEAIERENPISRSDWEEGCSRLKKIMSEFLREDHSPEEVWNSLQLTARTEETKGYYLDSYAKIIERN